jgi:hypothetical protein
MRAAGEAQDEAPGTLKSGVKLVLTPAFCQKNVTGKKRNYLCFHISDLPRTEMLI